MARLYEISYDETMWSIKGSRQMGYKLVDKKTLDSYHVGGDIIGIEQVADKSFLIYKRLLAEEWAITRVGMSDGKIFQEFFISFRNFEFLSEDLIFFDNYAIYSISKNKKIDLLNRVITQSFIETDEEYYKSRRIELVYDKNNDEYPSYFFIEYKLKSTEENHYIQVMVEVDTFLPVSPVYSTLTQNKMDIKFGKLKGLIYEQNNQLKVIDAFLRRMKEADSRLSVSEMKKIIK